MFAARDRSVRADVDNVAKPILDALKGIAYVDDRQIRSVRIVALPLDDAFGFRSGTPSATDRLFKADEFLVNIYAGLHLDVDIVEAKRPSNPPPCGR